MCLCVFGMVELKKLVNARMRPDHLFIEKNPKTLNLHLYKKLNFPRVFTLQLNTIVEKICT